MNGKKVAILFGAFALNSLAVQAQSWCPPGAEWTQAYNTVDWGSGMATEGFLLNRYVGDTVIGGHSAQHIQRMLYWRATGTTAYNLDNYAPKFTRVEDDVVYSWNGQDMFDTLLWFGAGVGDHWFLPDGGGAYRMTVGATSTALVGGLPLRKLAVSIETDSYIVSTDTLYERIGLLQGDAFDPVMAAVDGVSTGFLCYSDDALFFVKPGVQECGFTVNVDEAVAGQGPQVWPNPGSGDLFIRTGTSLAEVLLRDGAGGAVLSASGTGGQLVLGTGPLAPGIYVVEVISPAGQQRVKWVKQ